MHKQYRKDGRKLNTDPLRKIVGYKQVDVSNSPGMTMFLEHEEYECGHLALCKHDIYGDTNAIRRRCKQCGREAREASV